MSNLSKRQLRSGSKLSRKRNYRAPQKIAPLVGGVRRSERKRGVDFDPTLKNESLVKKNLGSPTTTIGGSNDKKKDLRSPKIFNGGAQLKNLGTPEVSSDDNAPLSKTPPDEKEAAANAEKERLAAAAKAEEERLAAEAAAKAEEERLAAEAAAKAEEERLAAKAVANEEEEAAKAVANEEEERLAAKAVAKAVANEEEERLAAKAVAKADDEILLTRDQINKMKTPETSIGRKGAYAHMNPNNNSGPFTEVVNKEKERKARKAAAQDAENRAANENARNAKAQNAEYRDQDEKEAEELARLAREQENEARAEDEARLAKEKPTETGPGFKHNLINLSVFPPLNKKDGEEDGLNTLIKSCSKLKKNYENKHKEVLLLGDIITAMKEEFDKLINTNIDTNDSTKELDQLKEKIDGKTLTDKTAISQAIGIINNDLETKYKEQADVLSKASKYIDNLVASKVHSNNDKSELTKLGKNAKQLANLHNTTKYKVEGMASTKKSHKKKPAKKPKKKSGHRRSKGKKRSKVSGKKMIKLTRRRGRSVSNA